MKNILILITLLSFLGCQKNPVNDSENIHILKGVWNRDNGPREYKFRNVPADAGFVNSFPFEAIQSGLPEDVIDSVDIQYWIYTSVDAAELAMVERLDMSNLYMHNIIDSPLSQGQIGDNCWHQLLVGAIQFLRNNVFVSITPNINNSSVDSSTIEWLARQVDMLIMESKKVDNANMIPAPNIISVEIISSLPEDWGQSVEVKVNATDPNSHKLTFREVGAGFALTNDNGIFSITPDKSKPVFVCKDPKKFRIMIWVWNEEHLVSLIEKEFTFKN